jgi:excisionase family DNA binding protein
MCDPVPVLVSVLTAARALDLSPSTVRRMIADGALPTETVRGKTRIPWWALRALAPEPPPVTPDQPAPAEEPR